MKAENFCLGCMKKREQGTVCPYCGYQYDTPPDSPLYLTPGTILNGKYLIGRVLGHGGFGITYLAFDLTLHVKLAIKEFLPRDIATRSSNTTTVTPYTGPSREHFEYGLEKFLEEARALARFEESPGIVTVKDFFRANETAYFTMNFVEGITFKEYLKSHGEKIDYDKALSILMPVMDALREVHQAGLLHRDISPDNIYITNDGRIKLLDFGAARNAAGGLSQSLSVMLKAGYAPEEQYRSKGKQGPWTDIYAVGATLYRAITGKVPMDALDRMNEDALEPPSRMGIKIPPHAERALLKALSVKAGDRFQEMKMFQQALMMGSDEENVKIPSGENHTRGKSYFTNDVSEEQKIVTSNNSQKKDNRYTGVVNGIAAIITIVFIISFKTQKYSQPWNPGSKHPDHPHIIASDTTNIWHPEPGYKWINKESGSLDVVWDKGSAHPDYPHVIASDKEGSWHPEPGYKFVNKKFGSLDVVWDKGSVHPDHPHVIASDKEGSWHPDTGYKFVNKKFGSLDVVWDKGSAHPYYPHVIASDKEGSWHPEKGYEWADPKSGSFDVVLIPKAKPQTATPAASTSQSAEPEYAYYEIIWNLYDSHFEGLMILKGNRGSFRVICIDRNTGHIYNLVDQSVTMRTFDDRTVLNCSNPISHYGTSYSPNNFISYNNGYMYMENENGYWSEEITSRKIQITNKYQIERILRKYRFK